MIRGLILTYIENQHKQMDVFIYNLSSHPVSHMLAIFNWYLERLLKVPLPLYNFNKKINTMKQSANSSYHDHNLIDSMLSRKQNKIINP